MFDQATIGTFLNTPHQTALFDVLNDTLVETVNKEFGYEANMADISYSVGNWLDNLGLKIKLEGYSGEELLRFGELFIETMVKCARKGGFEDRQVQSSVEATLKSSKNYNIEPYQHCSNNRVLFLTQSQLFHSSQEAPALSQMLTSCAAADHHDVGSFLQTLLSHVNHLKLFGFGRIPEADAIIRFAERVAG